MSEGVGFPEGNGEGDTQVRHFSELRRMQAVGRARTGGVRARLPSLNEGLASAPALPPPDRRAPPLPPGVVASTPSISFSISSWAGLVWCDNLQPADATLSAAAGQGFLQAKIYLLSPLTTSNGASQRCEAATELAGVLRWAVWGRAHVCPAA